MAQTMPRYFTARSGEQFPLVDPPPPIMQVIDNFIVGGRHLAEMDALVGVDAVGDLQLLSMSQARNFEEDLQKQITYNEVSSSEKRMLLLSRFYLFALQVLEQPGDSPGVNDPVYLYGKLFGSFPEHPQSVCIEGQLTVTRAELLHAIATGFKHSFNYAAGTHQTAPTRCCQLMIGADIETELSRGAGAVIVYPLPMAELAAADPSNELAVKQIVFDILQALKKDLEANKVRSRLSKIDLPVPSRRMLESSLESRGYAIKGNTATRKLPLAGPFDGVLERIYGAISGDKLDLPQEGSIQDFIGLAELAVQSIKDWPTERSKLVARLCRQASPEEISRASRNSDPLPAAKAIRTPRPSQVSAVDAAQMAAKDAKAVNHASAKNTAGAGRRSETGKVKSDPPAWMRDFMSTHKKASSAIITPIVFESQLENQTRQTAARTGSGSTLQDENNKNKSSKQTTGDSSEKEDWMSDFVETSKEIKHHKTKEEETESKPDWMSDFQ